MARSQIDESIPGFQVRACLVVQFDDLHNMLSSLDVTYEYTTELFLTPFYQLMQTCRKWNELLTRNNKCSDRATDSSPVVESITNQQKMTNYSECSKSRLTDLYQKTISLVSETRSLHHIEPINQTNGANYTDTLNQPEKIKMDPVNDDMDNDENHTFPDHLQIVEEFGAPQWCASTTTSYGIKPRNVGLAYERLNSKPKSSSLSDINI
ncbi:unnamed protein product [Schistosoma curassoni]|uniref:PDEase domain-containing protein n=1 Tax=Schistosoma curassoni TaxID=6186 RepID=A0A183KZ96_9TREM|nr:unnamed protein product [Schistosoma curassoni]